MAKSKLKHLLLVYARDRRRRRLLPSIESAFNLVVQLISSNSAAGSVAMTIADSMRSQPFSISPRPLTTSAEAGTVVATIGA